MKLAEADQVMVNSDAVGTSNFQDHAIAIVYYWNAIIHAVKAYIIICNVNLILITIETTLVHEGYPLLTNW